LSLLYDVIPGLTEYHLIYYNRLIKRTLDNSIRLTE
jgi:hypothetical protein